MEVKGVKRCIKQWKERNKKEEMAENVICKDKEQIRETNRLLRVMVSMMKEVCGCLKEGDEVYKKEGKQKEVTERKREMEKRKKKKAMEKGEEEEDKKKRKGEGHRKEKRRKKGRGGKDLR